MADSVVRPGQTRPSWFSYWRQDFLASLVVFLVALPLCMGIALASGAPVATGLVTGIIGGLVVGVLAGSPLQVSGPAAGLTVVCGEVIRQHGMPALGVVVLIAGVLQLLAGLFRMGQWFRAVSPAVVHGMLSGIGVLIFSSQLHVMVDDRPRDNGIQNIVSIPDTLIKGFPLPTLEESSTRRARIELLQQFGMLHERQDEIERGVERIVTRHRSEALHEWEQDHLADFLPAQRALLEDVRVAIGKYEASSVVQANGERARRLGEATAKAQRAMHVAAEDLAEGRLDAVKRSQADALAAVADVLANLKNHDWAAKIGLLSIAVIVLWRFVARGSLRLVPAPLLAVSTATVVAWGFALPVLYVEVPDDLTHGLTFPSWSVLEDVSARELLTAGIIMAVIASAETLLCATAIDRMHGGPRTRYDKELAAQGFGNMLCGLAGALPMTGVIVRSAANVQAGGKTRLSAILHGAWLLLFVLVMTPLLRMIPVAALAGILVYTGFKLIDFKEFFALWRQNRAEAAIFLITLVVIVVADLLIGVLTGVVLSAVKLLVTFSHLEVELSNSPGGHGRSKSRLSMSGAATFLRLPVLAARLEEVPPGAKLHVDFERLNYIDHACLELLVSWAKQHAASGGSLSIDWESLHARFKADNHASRPKAATAADRGGRRSDSAA
jgi:MFS superfamily sulfate permease-like transporter